MSSSKTMISTATAFTVLQRTLRNKKQPCNTHNWLQQPLQRHHRQQPLMFHPQPHISVAHFSRNRGGRHPFVTPQWLLNILQSSSSTSSNEAQQQQKQQDEVDPGIVEGTDLRVLKYPHASLRRQNAIITLEELQNGSIAKIAREMFIIMYAAKGVGLAAPQVGINKRLMVYNESGDRSKWINEVILINPVITEYSDTTDIDIEGCLSFPNMSGNVERSKWVKVEALNMKGKSIKKKYKGYEARIFQHEYDHLDGTVYIDRVMDDEQKRTVVVPRLAELVHDHDTKLYGEPAV